MAWSRRGPASSSCPKCSSPSSGAAGAGSTSHSPSLASSPFHPLPYFPSPSPPAHPAPVPAAGGCGARRGTSAVPFPWWLRRRPAAGGSYSGPGSMAGGTGTGGSGDRAQLGCGAGTPRGKTPQGAGDRGTMLSAHTPRTVQAGNGEVFPSWEALRPVSHEEHPRGCPPWACCHQSPVTTTGGPGPSMEVAMEEPLRVLSS